MQVGILVFIGLFLSDDPTVQVLTQIIEIHHAHPKDDGWSYPEVWTEQSLLDTALQCVGQGRVETRCYLFDQDIEMLAGGTEFPADEFQQRGVFMMKLLHGGSVAPKHLARVQYAEVLAQEGFQCFYLMEDDSIIKLLLAAKIVGDQCAVCLCLTRDGTDGYVIEAGIGKELRSGGQKPFTVVLFHSIVLLNHLI